MSKESACVFSEHEAHGLQDRPGRADCGGAGVAERSPGRWAQ